MTQAVDTNQMLDDLVLQVQGGDSEAFNDIMVQCHNELMGFLSVRVSNQDMLEEVAQSTWITCYNKIQGYEPRKTFLSWLKGIARFKVLEAIREKQRHLPVENDRLEHALLAQQARKASSNDDQQSDIFSKLQQCIHKLSPKARELIESYYHQNHPIEEIATDLQRSKSWVTVNLFRTRKALKQCLSSMGMGS